MTDPNEYLPGAAPAKKSSRAIWLWLVGLGGGAAIFRFLSPQAPAEAEASTPVPFASYVSLAVVAAVVAWLFAYYRALNALGALGTRSHKLAEAADHAGAEALVREGRRRFRMFRQLRASSDQNLASYAMQRGDFDGAIRLLESAQPRFALWSGVLRFNAACQLAWCHTLRGDLAEAERWLAEARRRRKVDDATGLVTLEMAISCRRGEAAQAAVRLEEQWPELERVQTGVFLRVARLVRAFALSAEGPRRAGEVERLVAELRPTRNREFASFGAAWPEMALFLRAHEL